MCRWSRVSWCSKCASSTSSTGNAFSRLSSSTCLLTDRTTSPAAAGRHAIREPTGRAAPAGRARGAGTRVCAPSATRRSAAGAAVGSQRLVRTWPAGRCPSWKPHPAPDAAKWRRQNGHAEAHIALRCSVAHPRPHSTPGAPLPLVGLRGFRLGLRRLSRVPMMQSAEHRQLDHASRLGRLDGAQLWRVPVERQMSATRLIVLGNESAKHPSQVALVHHDDVVQELSPKCADDALGVRILPRRASRPPRCLDCGHDVASSFRRFHRDLAACGVAPSPTGKLERAGSPSTRRMGCWSR